MGILMKRLVVGQNYWVCKLPKSDDNFIEPKLLELTDITAVLGFADTGRNYECTYIFGDIRIPTYMDIEVKSYAVSIDDFIVTNESAKMQMVIRNHVNPDMYKDKKIDLDLDVATINTYISDVDINHPELLI